VFEQGGPSKNIPVIDLSSSSNEEDFFTDTSRDAELASQLFGNLLRLPDKGKVIVLSDFDEEEEVREDTTTNANFTPSTTVKSLTPATSAVDVDEDLGKMQDDNSDDLAAG
jgi:endo-alpha-1,4-polygalactosaminidase (GH114 family)